MNIHKTKKAVSFALVFLSVLGACLAITGAYIHNKSQMEFAQMEQLVMARGNKVSNVITKLLYKTQALSALVIQSNGEVKDFERVAATILDDPAIRNVILAPGGVVRHVYPLEGNEQVMGFDYFSDSDGNLEAIQAKDTGQLVLGGPFNLVQGGQALVGRLPVYLENADGEKEFWGLVSVTLNYPQALSGAELEQLRDQGFAFEIWRVNPDTGRMQMIAESDYGHNPRARYVEKEITIMNAEWYFRISPIRNWYEYPETWIFSLAGLLASLLSALLVIHNFELKKVKAELEEVTYKDSLTGILNRRGLFKELEGALAPGNRFILCYIDLNKFKNINDSYGHVAGDRILRKFAGIFSQYTGHGHIFARIGGDEFILIFKGTDSMETVDRFMEQIDAEMGKEAFTEHGEEIPITFSIGKAAYPRDGESIDDLISIADDEMYTKKNGQ